MATKIRPEVSKKNEYYIPKYRYYELKYRCLQYGDWKTEFHDLLDLESRYFEIEKVYGGKAWDDVFKVVEKRERLRNYIDQVNTAIDALPEHLHKPIFEAVTEGKGWSVIQAKYELVCTRDEYYKAYHKFFYILDKVLA